MKKSICRRLTAFLLVLVIGLLLPACSLLSENIGEEMTTVYFSVIAEETETESKQDRQTEDNPSQAPPTKAETEAAPDSTVPAPQTAKTETTAPKAVIDENGKYDTKNEVALYIHTYGHLPSNYITKKQAQNLGWNGGSLKKYAPGCSIGGDRFGNYEGLLPKAKGRIYTECDIGTMHSNSRGAKRIIFSNDGLIYYTDNHYESFTQLYG